MSCGCGTAKFYDRETHSCVTICSLYHYPDLNAIVKPYRSCLRCPLPCKICTNSTYCSECIDGYTLTMSK